MSTGLALSRLPHETPSESVGCLPVRQDIDSAPIESMLGRPGLRSAPADYMPPTADVSVLELARFDGPGGDPSSRLWPRPMRSRQDALGRPAVSTQPAWTVGPPRPEGPPVPERLDVRDAIYQPGETDIDDHRQISAVRIRPLSDPAVQIRSCAEPQLQYESSVERISLPDPLGRGGNSCPLLSKGGNRHPPIRSNRPLGARMAHDLAPYAGPQPAPLVRDYPCQPALYEPSRVGITLPGVSRPAGLNSVQPGGPRCDRRDSHVRETQHAVPNEDRRAPNWQTKPRPVYEGWTPKGWMDESGL